MGQRQCGESYRTSSPLRQHSTASSIERASISQLEHFMQLYATLCDHEPLTHFCLATSKGVLSHFSAARPWCSSKMMTRLFAFLLLCIEEMGLGATAVCKKPRYSEVHYTYCPTQPGPRRKEEESRHAFIPCTVVVAFSVKWARVPTLITQTKRYKELFEGPLLAASFHMQMLINCWESCSNGIMPKITSTFLPYCEQIEWPTVRASFSITSGSRL